MILFTSVLYIYCQKCSKVDAASWSFASYHKALRKKVYWQRKKKPSEKSAFVFNVILSKLEIQIQNFNSATLKHYFLFS